ncbi:MAG: YciI family protein [Chloroflexota bacterium]
MTDPDLPEGVTIETVYAVEISYSPEAQAKRPAVRFEHLTRIARLLGDGRLVEAGGYLDWKSALLVVRASSEQEAIDLIRDDVYVRSGVWLDDAVARAFGRVVLDAGR